MDNFSVVYAVYMCVYVCMDAVSEGRERVQLDFPTVDESETDRFMIPFFTIAEFLVTVLISMEPCPVRDPPIGTAPGSDVIDLLFLIPFFSRRLEKVSISLDREWRFAVLVSGLTLTRELKLTVCPLEFFAAAAFLFVPRPLTFDGPCIAIGANAIWYGTWPCFPERNVGICPGSMSMYGFMTNTGIMGIIPDTPPLFFFFIIFVFFRFFLLLTMGSDEVTMSSASSLSSMMGSRPGDLGVACGPSSLDSSGHSPSILTLNGLPVTTISI